jgi:REP element-mobilizing transposase RayT
VPRKPRAEVEAGTFHVYARGNDKRAIYGDDDDRRLYVRLLAGTVRQFRWRLLAYCLMENHVHLLVETREPNLGRGIHRLHSSYAQRFNSRHGRSGHLFQGRYGCVRIESDEQLWTVAVYIAMNPVEAGLCRDAEDWTWSSHRAVLSGHRPDWLDVPRLLDCFAAAGGDGKRRYAELFLKGQSL